jgi:myosin heavy subunit
LGIQDAARFNYLSKSQCFSVEGVDDAKDFAEVIQAMRTINLSEAEQFSIFQIIAGVLHLGNVSFRSEGNYSQVCFAGRIYVSTNLSLIQILTLALITFDRKFRSILESAL